MTSSSQTQTQTQTPTPSQAATQAQAGRPTPHAGGRLTRPEWVSIGGMAAFVLLLHVVGWGVLAFIVAPQHYQVTSTTAFGIGLGVTAYTLGMRHAFDADHIAAIDNTTRKLMADGKRPVSVGFWFSLGHSSVVFGAVRAAGDRRQGAGRAGGGYDSSSLLQTVSGLIGTTVSGVFLIRHRRDQPGGAGRQILKVFARRCGPARSTRQALEEQLNKRGFMNRILGRVTRADHPKPWQMYPLGHPLRPRLRHRHRGLACSFSPVGSAAFNAALVRRS